MESVWARIEAASTCDVDACSSDQVERLVDLATTGQRLLDGLLMRWASKRQFRTRLLWKWKETKQNFSSTSATRLSLIVICLDLVEKDIRQQLSNTTLKDAPIVRISNKDKTGVLECVLIGGGES